MRTMRKWDHAEYHHTRYATNTHYRVRVWFNDSTPFFGEWQHDIYRLRGLVRHLLRNRDVAQWEIVRYDGEVMENTRSGVGVHSVHPESDQWPSLVALEEPQAGS